MVKEIATLLQDSIIERTCHDALFPKIVSVDHAEEDHTVTVTYLMPRVVPFITLTCEVSAHLFKEETDES